MSICIMSRDSDVYMYLEVEGYVCLCCRLTKKDRYKWHHNHVLKTPRGALAHLKKHLSVGDKVPKYAIKRIEKDIQHASK